jgi:hypothetical protein
VAGGLSSKLQSRSELIHQKQITPNIRDVGQSTWEAVTLESAGLFAGGEHTFQVWNFVSEHNTMTVLPEMPAA